MTWIKTEDQLPAHGQRVLALVKKYEEPSIVRFLTDKWIVESNGHIARDVTLAYDLWQPLPTRSNT